MQNGNQVMQLPGATIEFKESGVRRDVALLVAESGFAPTPHVHQHQEETFFVVSGSFEFLVGDEVLLAEAGTYVVVPPGTVHDFRNPGPDTACLLGTVTPGGLYPYFRELAAAIAEDRFDMQMLAETRRRYDAEPVELAWSLGGC